jgi:hypothetical protein
MWGLAASDCPKGLVNDPYPGQCGLYTDKNKDGICDLSQRTEAGQKETAEVSTDENAASIPAVSQERDTVNYHILHGTLFLVTAYIISLFLVKAGKIMACRNHLFWNLALSVSFAATAVTSLVLLLALTGVWQSDDIKYWSYWHVEAGYYMMVISVFHILWHGTYWRCYFKQKTMSNCLDQPKKGT